MSKPETADAETFRGPGEMRALMRAKDWSTTPVGPIATWPQSLKSTVKTLLASRYPMVLIWGPDFTQFYNDAYSKLIGDKHPSALGIDIRITLAEAWDTLGPMIREVMETGVANWVPAQQLLLERSGYREESYFTLSHAPAEDDAGRIVGMLAVCSEVTQQVVGDRRLRLLRDLASRAGETRSTETTSRDIAAAIGGHPLDVPFALIYLREPDGRTLALHGAVGIGSGGPLSPISADGDGSQALLGRAASGETVLIEDVGRHADIRGGPWGEPVRTALAMPLAAAGGAAPLGVLVAGISPNRALDEGYRSFYELLAGQVSVAVRNAQAYEEERRRAEALAEIDRAKTAFFSNVSHEFRTPLTLMLGPLEQLLGRPGRPPEEREDLEIVHRNGLRLLRLVNALLDFSRVEAGRAQASYEPTDLAALTADLASNFRSACERAGLTLTIDCPPLPEPVHVDREMWEKIVLNLLSNAFKFTLEGGITVALRAEDGAARLVVRDTGAGIASDQLPRVFERFHRIEGQHGRTHEGTGIGLALVQELVRLHGGAARVESAAGEGSTFTITIPFGRGHLPAERIGAPRTLASTATGAGAYVEEALRWLPDGQDAVDIPARPEPAPRSAPLHGAAEERARIVLADDNADMRGYIARLLAPHYHVVAVPDGAAALEAVRAEPPDLVLSDVMMPNLDGLGLLKALRAAPATRDMPVILLSARAGEDSSAEGLMLGADDYLVKPFGARELLARVRSILDLARMRREAGEALRQAQKMEAIGQLTGGVAHDFNNLLTGVIGNLDLLERRTSDPALLRFVQNARHAALRGAKLTEQLLAFSRKQRLEAQPTDVNQVLCGMGELLHRALGGTIGISTQLAKGLWSALADANQLELVVLNLAINARDAMPDGGTLAIETANAAIGAAEGGHDLPPGDYVLVSVSDTGTGMPEEVRARAFEPFFTTKGVGKGTGLGLSQVYGVVRQLGGGARIDSVPGRGTTVRLYFPRAAAAVSGTAHPGATAEERQGSGATILVVDDDQDVRGVAAMFLSELGYAVIEADSGPTALQILDRAAPVDLLFADYAMPQMTGLELVARAHAKRPDLAVLFMTGYADTPALAGLADDVVVKKPFKIGDLAGKLEGALAHAAERRGNVLPLRTPR